MKPLNTCKRYGWKSFIDSFKPLPLPMVIVRKKDPMTANLFVSPAVTQVETMPLSAEGNTSLFAGRVTTEEDMQHSLDRVEHYVF